MTFFIEYNIIPTRHNPTQTIETDNPQLFVNATGENKLVFTDYAKRNTNVGNYGAIISRIYQEDLNRNQIELLYIEEKHFGDRLKKLLKPAPKEILV
jgi:hypothetical protein